MTKKHQKHAKISQPALGKFGRNEFSILGTTCDEIKKIAQVITSYLSSSYKIAYIDADHKSADDSSNLNNSPLGQGFNLALTDKIDFNQFDIKGPFNTFQNRAIFNEQDLILINGNHFESNNQIVVIDSRKSLEKKLHKLTNVVLILFADESQILPEYLSYHLNGANNIPKLNWKDSQAIADFISQNIRDNQPQLNGLILSGGKSERMQKDKSQIAYFDKPQKEHMYDLVDHFTKKTYYAVREDQADVVDQNLIADSFTGLGPYGAILSAFRHDPNSAWLVTACDQPFLTKETLAFLVKNRNTSKVATAFYNPETDFPEPLVTIWEPRAYMHLLNYLAQGFSCPRKVLINSDIELVKLEDARVLRNVNTPEEYELAIKEIKN